jgi:uncharacterized Zn finger protein
MPPEYDTQHAQEWWVEAWLDLLSRYRFKKRLERAREYARQGNVLSVDFQGPKVIARVRGKEQPEYQVSLWLDAFSDEQWDYIVETMAERAIFSAKLLAGEMPQNIEDVFTANGLSLFPFSLSEVHSRCSCPDPANPCKHIGAVYYVLADRFSDDPFVLFQLRGRDRDHIIATLRQLRSAAGDDKATEVSAPRPSASLNLENFWQYQQQLEPSLVVIAPPPSSETILDVLGPIPLKPELVGNMAQTPAITQAVMDYLRQVYQTLSQHAVLSAMTTEP